MSAAEQKRLLAAFADTFWAGVELRSVEANGQPAVLISRDGATVAPVTISASDDDIDHILWAMNPQKLTAITAGGPPRPVADGGGPHDRAGT